MHNKLLLLSLLVILSNPGHAAKIYKWIDEHGTTHFSANRPARAQVEVVEPKFVKAPPTKPKPSANEGAANPPPPGASEPNKQLRELAAQCEANGGKNCDSILAK